MKNEFGNAISEVQPQLAIVKRIDEIPGWKKVIDKAEARTERSFEPPKQPSNQPKKTKKKQAKNSFKNWNLPIQPEGYLKPRINDLL
jgi:hypothetical protein